MSHSKVTISNWAKILLLAFVAETTACKKLVDAGPPVTEVVGTTVFNNDATATSAVLGIYSYMMSVAPTITAGGTTIYTGLLSDELYYTGTSTTIAQFATNSISITNSTVEGSFWSNAYHILYQINACINGINSSTGITPSTQKQLLGECQFARAFVYSVLINLFGEVPLETTANYLTNESLARTPVESVYQQIVSDLQNASQLLEPAYPTPGRVRPNKWTALALLARVSLYQKDWATADNLSTQIINSGAYTLVHNLDSVFLANSPEAIWQLMPVFSSYNTTEGANFVPSPSATAKPNYAISSYLLNAFEPGDQRPVDWMNSKVISGQTYFYPFKYKIRFPASTVTEYYTVVRLAEQYLIRAEAKLEENDLPDAISDLNTIRQRAGLPNLSDSLSQSQVLSALIQERRTELFCEWGNRWFDLRRFNIIDQVLDTIKTNWKATDTLFPIPNSEIMLNPSLIQNPGY